MTKSKFNTASLAAVEIIPGNPIQGLMTDEGEFYVAVPQVAERFSFAIKHASRNIKALLGAGSKNPTSLSVKGPKALLGAGSKNPTNLSVKGPEFVKLKTPFNKRAVNCLRLEDYERVVLRLALKGNVLAADEMELVVGLGYRQKFCDSFGIKFDQADGEAFLKARYEGIVQRRNETDAIQQYIDGHPELSDNAVKFMYSNVTDTAYRCVFGLSARYLYEILGPMGANKKSGNLGDFLPAKGLKEVENIENMASRLITKLDMHPRLAVIEASERLMVDKIAIG